MDAGTELLKIEKNEKEKSKKFKKRTSVQRTKGGTYGEKNDI